MLERVPARHAVSAILRPCFEPSKHEYAEQLLSTRLFRGSHEVSKRADSARLAALRGAEDSCEQLACMGRSG